MGIKLVMFDFDGTLVDTAPDLITAVNLLLKKYQKEPLPAESIRAVIGSGLISLIHSILPESENNPKLEREFLEIYERELLRTPKLYPGALEFLTQTAPQQNLHLAIVSNKREWMIHRILKHLKLDLIPWVDIVGGDSLPNMKPDPAPFLRAIHKAGVQVHEAVIVGDGTPDIDGARAAGCHSIAVDFGYGAISELMRLGAHGKISHYSLLHSALKDLTD